MIRLYIIDFFTSFCFVSNVMNLYFEHIGYSFTEIGILFGILQVSKFIFEIPTGLIADKYGRKTSLVIGIVFQIISFFLLLINFNIIINLIAMILLGCAYTFSTGTTSAILVEMCKIEKKDLYHANTISWYLYYIACGIGAILSGVMISSSFNYVFYLDIISLVISLLILMSLNSKAVLEKEEHLKVKDVFEYLIQNKRLHYYILVGIIIDFVMMPIDSLYNNYLYNDFNFSYSLIGFIVAAQFILQGVIVYVCEKMIAKIDKKFVVKLFPVFTMCIFFAFSIVRIAYISVIIYILGWMFYSSYISVFDTEKQKCISSKYRSSALSFESLLVAFGASGTKILYGYLSDLIGMHITMTCFVLAGILFLLIIGNFYIDDLKQVKGGEKMESVNDKIIESTTEVQTADDNCMYGGNKIC